MSKLKLFICQNMYPEYQHILQQEGYEDIELQILPSLCAHKGNKNKAMTMFAKAGDQPGVLICSQACELVKISPQNDNFQIKSGSYCFSYLTSDDFLNYLIVQGNYIISTGWLRKWQDHMAEMGLDKQTAKRFFRESCEQLVYLNANLEGKAETFLKELSSYVGLPYRMISIDLETIRLLLNNVTYAWRLHNQEKESASDLNALRMQCAEYASVFDMLGKISTYTSKRDVIGKIKELFLIVFGAQQFKFWSDDTDSSLQRFYSFSKQQNKDFMLLKNENRFLIRVTWDGELYGIVDAGGFLFPQYIEKYLNLALEITKFCGLVLHNNEQYEKILTSEKELKHISSHDAMTGLHNRDYVYRVISEHETSQGMVVFMFDIDRLKYVNDHFGHAEGDELIKSFAQVLKRSFRETDLIARVGGDEFAAFLFNADESTALQIRERVNELITANNEVLEKAHLALSVSAGYALMENEKDTIEAIMQRADERMYIDKMRKKTAQ